MSTFSADAKAYAFNKRFHTLDCPCATCTAEMAAYDAGVAARPSLDEITPSDHRWEEGARVRLEFPNKSALEGKLVRNQVAPGWFLDYGNRFMRSWAHRYGDHVYLLAEAPRDPRVDVVNDWVHSLDTLPGAYIDAPSLLALLDALKDSK